MLLLTLFFLIVLTEEVTSECNGNEVNSLLVLLEEELVAIDLSSDKWPLHRLPYLHSMHSSAITSAQHVTNIPISLSVISLPKILALAK